MSGFDGDWELFNIKAPTLGGIFFWEDLENRAGYRLQQNLITGHCRILDENDVRVACGGESAMWTELVKLTSKGKNIHPYYGDVICVHRNNGIYDHYGVYEDDGHVYEYAAPDNDFGIKNIQIRCTTLQKFVRNSKHYFILKFPEYYGKPIKIEAAMTAGAINLHIFHKMKELKQRNYHLYSPEETVWRAKSRLGETNYNLLFNNCEHFAIWCKTGISESHQVNGVIELLPEPVSIDI